MALELIHPENGTIVPGDLLVDDGHTFLVICYDRLYVHSPGKYRLLRNDGRTMEFSWTHMVRKGWRRLA